MSDPVNAEILGWITEWAPKAKAFAEDPEHWLGAREDRAKYTEHLRLPTRLADWDSDIVYWYYVKTGTDGRRYRVLAIHTSVWTHASTRDAAARQAAIDRQKMESPASKALWLNYWADTGLIRLFFPLHTSTAFTLVTTEPRFVAGKREGLASWRFGVEWSILVPDETSAGVGGALNDARSSSPLVDKDGNPIRKPVRNIALDSVQATTVQVDPDQTASTFDDVGDDGNPPGKVLPLNRAQRRQAERDSRSKHNKS